MFEFSNKKILPKIRLFLDIKLDLSGDILNQKLQINNNDFDYLIKVMRQKIGDEIMIFNGFDGDFIGKIIDIQKKSLTLEIVEKIADLRKSPNIT